MKVIHPRVVEITTHLTTARETYAHAKRTAQTGLKPLIGDGTGDTTVLRQCKDVAKEFGFDLVYAAPLPDVTHDQPAPGSVDGDKEI